MKEKKEYSYKNFIEFFVHPPMILLRSITEPRINEDIKRIFHLSDQAKIGDWYLYHKYTNMRVYDCEFSTYKLPKFLPMRIFALEYIRKMLNANEDHLV